MPDGFYDSFKYTSSGRNLTHPLTIGLLARHLSQHRGVAHVGVDVRLGKFSPDIVAYDDDMRPLVFIDYESPNSSDLRVIEKDIDKYLAWIDSAENNVPYVVITTLPNSRPSKWQLRWFSDDGYNKTMRSRRDEIRENPFQFWYGVYRKELRRKNLNGITFLNISGRKVTQVRV